MPPKAKKKVDDDNKKRDLTDGGFTELLIRHFVGDVGAHQDADLDLQLLSDDVWDKLQTLWSLIDTLEDNNKGQCGLRSYLLLTPDVETVNHWYKRTQWFFTERTVKKCITFAEYTSRPKYLRICHRQRFTMFTKFLLTKQLIKLHNSLRESGESLDRRQRRSLYGLMCHVYHQYNLTVFINLVLMSNQLKQWFQTTATVDTAI